MTASSAGSSTSASRASLQHQRVREVVDVLRVQAKWMNSATAITSALSARRSFSQYSIALTSWLVRASMALMASPSSGARIDAPPRRVRPASPAEKAGISAKCGLGGQRLEPGDLDPHAVADQAEFRKMRAQRLDLAGIAAVERREGCQRSQGHVRKPSGTSANFITRRQLPQTWP
jgi:hypothetical protein